jgi:hypothetical protein
MLCFLVVLIDCRKRIARCTSWYRGENVAPSNRNRWHKRAVQSTYSHDDDRPCAS